MYTYKLRTGTKPVRQNKNVEMISDDNNRYMGSCSGGK